MNNLFVRALSGIVYVAVIVASILLGDTWFFLLTAVMAALGIGELQNIVLQKRHSFLSGVIFFIDMVTAVALVWLPLSGNAGKLAPAIAMAYFLIRGVLALYDRRERPFRAAAWSVMSVCYLGLPLMALNSIYLSTQSSALLVLIIFAMIWLNDTGAYCVGSTLGRHRMFPRLSPKKSWEGFAGGCLFCLLAGGACFLWFNTQNWQLWQWLMTGLTVCIFSTWGDLFESLIKRNAGIKDSGKLIPGHGGILDRIDSLLFVAPAMALVITLFM